MKAHRITATITTLALAASLMHAPALAAPKSQKTTPVKKGIDIELTITNGENVCHYRPENDTYAALLDVNQRYQELLSSLRQAIRKDLPVDKNLFARADAITGTGPTPNEGSLDDPELATIIATVREAMIAQGFAADGSETHFAFYHSPQGHDIAERIKPQDLVLLPPMNVQQASRALALPTDNRNSLKNKAERFFTAAAALRAFVDKDINRGSIALLNRLDDEKAAQVSAAVKEITSTTPTAIEAEARYWVHRCVSRIRTTALWDGTASSKLSNDPGESSRGEGSGSGGSSNPAGEDKPGLTAASSELSSGRGLSSGEEIYDTFVHGSSGDDEEGNGWQAKLSTLVVIIGGIVTIITGVLRFGGLFQAIISRPEVLKEIREDEKNKQQ